MQTIEARVSVDEDRNLAVQLPTDVQIGEYDIVRILNSAFQASTSSNLTAVEKAQSLLSQSVEPSRSLAHELIQERREKSRNE